MVYYHKAESHHAKGLKELDFYQFCNVLLKLILQSTCKSSGSKPLWDS